MSSIESDPISHFARVDFRSDRRMFGIKQAERLFHTYAIGKTGAGKSTLLETLILQDIFAGRGAAFIDPHGWSTESRQPCRRIEWPIFDT